MHSFMRATFLSRETGLQSERTQATIQCALFLGFSIRLLLPAHMHSTTTRHELQAPSRIAVQKKYLTQPENYDTL
jgi:hypothetical protein